VYFNPKYLNVTRSCPYLSTARTPNLSPSRSRRFTLKTLARSAPPPSPPWAAAAPLPLAVKQPPQKLHAVVRTLAGPSFPFPSAFPWPHDLTGFPEPPLAVASPLRPISLPLDPLDRLLVPPAISQGKPHSKPRLGMRNCVLPGEAPPQPPRIPHHR
jgi:hypothetical protein